MSATSKETRRMPVLARFYGIKVTVHFDDHPPPHVHVDYQGHSASLAIETLEFYKGGLPRRVRVMVVEWALQHRDELRWAWIAVRRHEHPASIEPLE